MSDGQVVVITGAGSGIGAAIAERLARPGNRLVLGQWGRSIEAPEHPDGPESILSLEVDVRSREDAAKFIDAAEQRFGRIDALVTSAGVHREGPSESAPWEDWDEVLSVNLSGTYACIRAALPGMLRNGCGRIVTIASELGIAGMGESTAYCASKGGVIAMTKALAREYVGRNILVNSVAPGPVLTPLLEESSEHADGSALAGLPIGRYGEPREIAAVVEALLGDAGTFFVGQILSPNGGAVI